jgi:hypothetical protein
MIGKNARHLAPLVLPITPWLLLAFSEGKNIGRTQEIRSLKTQSKAILLAKSLLLKALKIFQVLPILKIGKILVERYQFPSEYSGGSRR